MLFQPLTLFVISNINSKGRSSANELIILQCMMVYTVYAYHHHIIHNIVTTILFILIFFYENSYIWWQNVLRIHKTKYCLGSKLLSHQAHHEAINLSCLLIGICK